MSNYDLLRMKLICDHEEFYVAYKEALAKLKTHFKKNPEKKNSYPFLPNVGYMVLEFIALVLMLYLLMWLV